MFVVYSVISVVSLFVLLPIDATAPYSNYSGGDLGIFSLASIGYTSARSWAHIVVSFVVMLTFFILSVVIECCFLIDIKPNKNLSLILEISNVPKEFDKEYIKSEIEKDLGTTIYEVSQVYDLYNLKKLILKRDKLKKSSIESVQEKFEKLTTEIEEEKKKDLSTGIYYVQFNNSDDMKKYKANPTQSFSKYKIRDAIDPSDIIEKNVGVSLCSKIARMIFSYFITIILVVIVFALTFSVYLALAVLTFQGGIISINILQVFKLNVDDLYDLLPILYILIYNAPYILTALNDVFEIIFIALTEFEKHYSMDNQNFSLIIKLIIFNFGSTTVVPVSVFIYLTTSLHNSIVGKQYIASNYFLTYNLLSNPVFLTL